jgi:hypothetical protein
MSFVEFALLVSKPLKPHTILRLSEKYQTFFSDGKHREMGLLYNVNKSLNMFYYYEVYCSPAPYRDFNIISLMLTNIHKANVKKLVAEMESWLLVDQCFAGLKGLEEVILGVECVCVPIEAFRDCLKLCQVTFSPFTHTIGSFDS